MPRYLLKQYLQVCVRVFLKERSIYIVGRVSRWVSPVLARLHPTCWRPGGRITSSLMVELCTLMIRPSDSDRSLHHQLPAPRPWDHIAGSPGSSACRLQIIRLPRFHSCVNQTYNKSLHTYTCAHANICICTHTCRDIYSRSYMHTYIHICMHAVTQCKHIHMHACSVIIHMHMCVHIHACVYIFMCMWTCK